MKKILTIMLALIISVSISTLFIACNNSEPENTDPTEPTAPVYTVTEQEWANYFNTVNDGNYRFEANVVMGQNRTTMVVGRYGNVVCMTSDFETGYVSFDDSALTCTMYYLENTVWGKQTSSTEQEYLEQKKNFSLNGIVFTEFLGAVEQDGEIVGIEQIFSAFTYNEGEYSATLYISGEPIYWTIKFEDGKMVSLNVVQGENSLTGTTVYDGFEIIIPQEALNAGSVD